MKIGMVLESTFPHDNRVEKEARSLIQAGHELFLLCYADGNDQTEEIWKGIRIIRIPLRRSTAKKMLGLFFIAPFFHLYWKKVIEQFVLHYHVEILHIHDLPLCGPALKVAQKHNLNVVCDMHEDFANWVLNTPLYNQGFKKYLRVFQRWKQYERDCLRACYKIIGVSAPLVEKMITEYNLKRENVICVPNTPDLELFVAGNELETNDSNSFRLVYSGGIDPLRGIQNVIPIVPEIVKLIPEFEFVILGDGRYLQELKQLATSYHLEKVIDFKGFCSIEVMKDIIKSCHVGVYPQLKYEGIDETMPTKLYQYCALGLPVISSDHTLPKEFIEQYDCGFTLNFETEKTKFVDVLFDLKHHELKRREMGARGKNAIHQYYNWNATVIPLIEMYNQLVK